MPYYKLLQNIIGETDFTQKEVAEKCLEHGVSITRTYINKLENNKLPPPTEDVSRAIAKVCNVDERLLVIEGYIDKAPKEIIEMLNNLYFIEQVACSTVIENELDNNSLKEFKEQSENQTLSKFIIQLMDSAKTIVERKDSGLQLQSMDNSVMLNLQSPSGIKIEDNSMYPLLKENDEITIQIQEKYKNGDIILLINKKENKTVVRQAFFLGRDIELIALNKKFETKIYKSEDITILGKVKKIITEINN